ncbi:PEP-utilizing protein [Actinobacteria bacterium YIM 96077]|uniref:PEP-utilizing protein n=1 Tax=Phytoactinopolyspora halophila TaxID=1981511 RepID=A0A329QBJ1_9ACTN|nr:PEP-utilizing enzyme [Phytoactinopolyspora halophila]AYY13707.1 PEP-utilizing protein [Actinobacteria bacterium YIM 96077]RAW09361.1 PEP-utilizing protein [Phytoactinopolyspora halophila]
MTQPIATFFGDDEFPITWEEGQQQLLWVHDDLHIPNPVSPMYADIGGWWLKCDYMFRRFGTPFASDWIVKIINGYVYTAAVPATKGLSAEAFEYGARYTPRTPLDDNYAAEIGGYLGWTLPYYAENFLDWWHGRLVPEITRNFERFDTYDYENASLVELAILLEDAIDMHDRHWQIHWVLNFAQFSATTNLNALIAEVKGEGDHSALMGRLQSSTTNRNWDSIEELWKIKEKIVSSPNSPVARAFEQQSAGDVLAELRHADEGRQFLDTDIEQYQQVFGYKSMYAHEFAFKTWREDPSPIIEAIRGYIETGYSFPDEIAAVAKDLEAAKAEVMEGVPEGEDRDRLAHALDLSLRMNPLTPDHHFYIDQGTNARVRLVLIAIGKKLTEAGKLDDPEDVMYLKYNELRTLMAGSNSFDQRELVGNRRDEREAAYEIRPRDWVGTATEEHLAFPYLSLWGFPEKLYRPQATTEDEVRGLAASAGVIEGTARVVLSQEEFDDVERDEIVVCRMTSPAWVVLFTRIGGLVTDAGGMASHPAVVSREFGLPAVVGTSDATRRIATGDRVRVNGTTGLVQVLS